MRSGASSAWAPTRRVRRTISRRPSYSVSAICASDALDLPAGLLQELEHLGVPESRVGAQQLGAGRAGPPDALRKTAGTSHRGVTREAVAAAAADLVATDGLEALSVRQVANSLGVWPTTVMHHAGGRRDGLLALLIEHLAAGIATEPRGSWRTRLVELGHEIRRVALTHRGLADELLRSGATGPQALRLADAILAALQDAGLDHDDAQDAYDLFLTYVLGSAGRQTKATAPARWRAFERALDHAEPDTYPALRRATRSGTPRDDDARFIGGLDLVLDAIADRASR
jgi:TetR/AcrR family tetracycline transcriptional repressor